MDCSFDNRLIQTFTLVFFGLITSFGWFERTNSLPLNLLGHKTKKEQF